MRLPYRPIDKLYETPLRNQSTVIRYSGYQLVRPETVDVHTMDMTVLALVILDDLPGYLDRKDLIYRIVVHDLEESCSCDVPRSLKYHSPEVHAAIVV
jgi:5'-deoxynucleotidase YfbR-like HD superfamily hydrolase